MTSPSNATNRYHPLSIYLHWLLALALATMFGVGIYMADLPFSPERLKLMNWHKWAGIVVLALSIFRLVWRIARPAPALPQPMLDAMPTWQLRAYKGTHWGLYALFFAVPLVGWAYSSAAGFPVVLFGLFPLPDWVATDKALAELIKPWHQITAFALAFLVMLHVAAALKHHFIDRDGLLKRMALRN